MDLDLALWFILRGNLLYVLPCVILFLCFSILLPLRLPRLGKRELILVRFVRLFNLCLFGFVGFLLLLGSGKGCGLWLSHSLDFSLTLFLHRHTTRGFFSLQLLLCLHAQKRVNNFLCWKCTIIQLTNFICIAIYHKKITMIYNPSFLCHGHVPTVAYNMLHLLLLFKTPKISQLAVKWGLLSCHV